MQSFGFNQATDIMHAILAAASEQRQGTRLPLNVAVALRPHAGEPWSFGRTVNVSRSGVLIECGPEMATVGALEFVIGVASGIPGSCNVQCRGRVVRIEHAAGGRRIAVTIDAFAYVPDLAA
jgi:hypothetical protein